MSVLKYGTLHLSVFFQLPQINASRIFFIPRFTKNSLHARPDIMYRMSFTFEDKVKKFHTEARRAVQCSPLPTDRPGRQERPDRPDRQERPQNRQTRQTRLTRLTRLTYKQWPCYTAQKQRP